MRTFYTLAIVLGLVSTLFSQEAGNARLKEISGMIQEDTTRWSVGLGAGLDLAGMGLINPRIGAGTPRLGFGGLGTLFVRYKSDKDYWNNNFSLQFSAQRLGRASTDLPKGFQKNLDVLQFNSRYGHRTSASGKWFIAADMTVRTQLLKTYSSNYLKPINLEDRVVSRFLAPMQLTFSPGIDYKPNAHLSFFYSPVGIQYILVNDDAIAKTNVFGNEEGKNYFLGLGSELKAAYTDKFFNDRFALTSQLRLFSNYLKEPQNVDVLFGNNFSILIFKGLSLDILAEYLYDNDVKVQKDVNGDGVYNVVVNPDGTTSGTDRLGRGGQFTGAFLLKYSIIF